MSRIRYYHVGRSLPATRILHHHIILWRVHRSLIYVSTAVKEIVFYTSLIDSVLIWYVYGTFLHNLRLVSVVTGLIILVRATGVALFLSDVHWFILLGPTMWAGRSTISLKEILGAIFANNHIFLSTVSVLLIVILGIEGLGIAVSGILWREILNSSLQTTLGRHTLWILIFGSLRLVLSIKIGHGVVLVWVKLLLWKIHNLLTVSVHIVVIEPESVRFAKVWLRSLTVSRLGLIVVQWLVSRVIALICVYSLDHMVLATLSRVVDICSGNHTFLVYCRNLLLFLLSYYLFVVLKQLTRLILLGRVWYITIGLVVTSRLLSGVHPLLLIWLSRLVQKRRHHALRKVLRLYLLVVILRSRGRKVLLRQI